MGDGGTAAPRLHHNLPETPTPVLPAFFFSSLPGSCFRVAATSTVHAVGRCRPSSSPLFSFPVLLREREYVALLHLGWVKVGQVEDCMGDTCAPGNEGWGGRGVFSFRREFSRHSVLYISD